MRKITKAVRILVFVLLLSVMLHASVTHNRMQPTRPAMDRVSDYDGLMPNVLLFGR